MSLVCKRYRGIFSYPSMVAAVFIVQGKSCCTKVYIGTPEMKTLCIIDGSSIYDTKRLHLWHYYNLKIWGELLPLSELPPLTRKGRVHYNGWQLCQGNPPKNAAIVSIAEGDEDLCIIKAKSKHSSFSLVEVMKYVVGSNHQPKIQELLPSLQEIRRGILKRLVVGFVNAPWYGNGIFALYHREGDQWMYLYLDSNGEKIHANPKALRAMYQSKPYSEDGVALLRQEWVPELCQILNKRGLDIMEDMAALF